MHDYVNTSTKLDTLSSNIGSRGKLLPAGLHKKCSNNLDHLLGQWGAASALGMLSVPEIFVLTF